MNKNLIKFLHKHSLAIAVGIMVLFLFYPPSFLKSVSLLTYILIPISLLFFFLIWQGFYYGRAMTKELKKIPLSKPITNNEIIQLCNSLKSLGFADSGIKYELENRPGILIGFVNEEIQTYGFIAGAEISIGLVTTIFFNSIFQGDFGGLGTHQKHAGISSMAAGSLRQVFPRANPQELLNNHLRAISYLKKEGINLRPVNATTLENDIKIGEKKYISHFRSAPIRNTILILWTAIINKTPYFGPIENQKIAKKQIAYLRSSYKV